MIKKLSAKKWFIYPTKPNKKRIGLIGVKRKKFFVFAKNIHIDFRIFAL